MAETVYSETSDSYVTHTEIGTDPADVVGDATTAGSFHSNTAILYNWGVRNRTFAVRGGGGNSSFRCHRSFFAFDLSSLSGTATDADFYFYSDNLGTNATNESTIYVVQATALAGSTADFGNVFSSGTTLGTTLAEGQVSTTLQYHTITGNSNLLTAINSVIGSGTLTVGVMGYYDYRIAAGIAAASTWPAIGGNFVKIQMYYADGGGTSKDPYLYITLASGYTHKVLGVAAGDIGKVKGVATADIDKVIGVD
tara:strand:+ start:1847 stop:2605 length:759 start_codon:yes stop_codon:yes gene_type:complete